MLLTLLIGSFLSSLPQYSILQKKNPIEHTQTTTLQENKQNSSSLSTHTLVDYTAPQASKKVLLKPLDKWFHASLRYNHSLGGVITGKDSSARETLDLNLNINPLSHWFVNVTFSKYLNSYNDLSYKPDFSYSFGYRNWQNNSFSLVYSNYENNQFDPHGGYERFNFDGGTWNFSYKNIFKGFNYRIGATYRDKEHQKRLYLDLSRRFFDKRLLVSLNLTKDLTYHDTRASLGFHYDAKSNFFVSSKFYYFSDVRYQEDYEGDYAFAVGYKFKEPKITIKYSNFYMKTRYPWREDSKGVDLLDGYFSISWDLKF